MKKVISIVVFVLIILGIYLLINSKAYSPTPSTSDSVNNPVQTVINNTESTSANPSQVAVKISNFSFNPGVITVKKGTSVTWTNEDPMSHTITGNNGGPKSDAIPNGGNYSYKFDTVGTFPYHCSIHPSMNGSVVVTN